MSGGSFDYACWCSDLHDLLEKSGSWQELMEAFEDNNCDDIAAEIDAMLKYVNLTDRRVKARLARLTEVAKALEWWYSCDHGEDDFKAAVAEWRKKYTGTEE